MAATAPDPRTSPSLLMIDNYDSFTFNLVQHLEELGASVIVSRVNGRTFFWPGVSHFLGASVVI